MIKFETIILEYGDLMPGTLAIKYTSCALKQENENTWNKCNCGWTNVVQLPLTSSKLRITTEVIQNIADDIRNKLKYFIIPTIFKFRNTA